MNGPSRSHAIGYRFTLTSSSLPCDWLTRFLAYHWLKERAATRLVSVIFLFQMIFFLSHDFSRRLHLWLCSSFFSFSFFFLLSTLHILFFCHLHLLHFSRFFLFIFFLLFFVYFHFIIFTFPSVLRLSSFFVLFSLPSFTIYIPFYVFIFCFIPLMIFLALPSSAVYSFQCFPPLSLSKVRVHSILLRQRFKFHFSTCILPARLLHILV